MIKIEREDRLKAGPGSGQFYTRKMDPSRHLISMHFDEEFIWNYQRVERVSDEYGLRDGYAIFIGTNTDQARGRIVEKLDESTSKEYDEALVK